MSVCVHVSFACLFVCLRWLKQWFSSIVLKKCTKGVPVNRYFLTVLAKKMSILCFGTKPCTYF